MTNLYDGGKASLLVGEEQEEMDSLEDQYQKHTNPQR
jgi:hypothetical protein